MYADGVAGVPFTGSVETTFPPDWLNRAPGKVLTSVLVRVEQGETVPVLADADYARMRDWFVPESLAMSSVIDGQAIAASDFRIDAAGHVRFALLVRPDIGPRRLGRIVQRLVEIETYKSIAMLTLPVARQAAARVAELDGEMSALVRTMVDVRRKGIANARPASRNVCGNRGPVFLLSISLRCRGSLCGHRPREDQRTARRTSHGAANSRRVHAAGVSIPRCERAGPRKVGWMNSPSEPPGRPPFCGHGWR